MTYLIDWLMNLSSQYSLRHTEKAGSELPAGKIDYILKVAKSVSVQLCQGIHDQIF